MSIEQPLNEIQKDIRNLKLKAFTPDKNMAQCFLDYLSWQDVDSKIKFETIYAKELEILNEWLEIYCTEHNCSKEDALFRIIED